MKSYILNILLLCSSAYAFSQVGINTRTAQSTLHVDGNTQFTKEFSVGGNGTTYGDVGKTNNILLSNGTGQAPTWSKIEDIEIIPLIVGLGLKTDVLTPTPLGGASYAAGASTTLIFNTAPKMNVNYLSYNSVTGVYTVNKAGYYKVIGYLAYDLEDNDDVAGPPYNTAGTALTQIMKNNTDVIVATSTYHHDITTFVYHTVSGTAYFTVGDQISLTGRHTQKYKFGKSNLSILYTGQ